MAIEFKPKDASYKGASQYKDGQIIPCAVFKTEVLPRGTPTARFDPYLSTDRRCFLISVAVGIQRNKIILYALSKGQTVRKDVLGYAMSYALFPGGIPVTMVHDGKDFPGILRPLSAVLQAR